MIKLSGYHGIGMYRGKLKSMENRAEVAHPRHNWRCHWRFI